MPTTRRKFLKVSGLSGLAFTAGFPELHASKITPLAENEYDLIIVGGTPGGIMAAVAASRLGQKSLILERTGPYRWLTCQRSRSHRHCNAGCHRRLIS